MNYKIARRAASLSPSLTLAIDSKAKQMKAEGLVNEKNLGQVTSSYEHHLHDSGGAAANGRTTVTTANGHAFASGSDNGHTPTGKWDQAGSDGAGHGPASADHGHDE